MTDRARDIGIIGLGVMGRNFALNLAEHGYAVAGFDLDQEKVDRLTSEASGQQDIRGASDLNQFIGSLRSPRAVLTLVPAGSAVDSVLDELVPLLREGDVVIDSGNSRFVDTDRRQERLSKKGLLFLGMGISGGERGARHGPSMMPGGSKEGFDRVRPMLEAAAAHVDGEPCVAYLGKGSAGHYVKMAHNGIEYAFMQLIAESYDLARRCLGLDAESLQKVFAGWASSNLSGYLIEATAEVLARRDEETGRPLVELVLDSAKQTGTGKWVSWDAMELQVPVPGIDTAVMMRNLSEHKPERELLSQVLSGPDGSPASDRDAFLEDLREALYAAMILVYGQGFALLHHASSTYGYELDLEVVARIWRGGCIIRAALLEDIRSAFRNRPGMSTLLLDRALAGRVSHRQQNLRNVIRAGVDRGVPVPGFMAALGYFDGYRSGRSPANLIQSLRDYFGSHTYERTDKEGVFHTQWSG